MSPLLSEVFGAWLPNFRVLVFKKTKIVALNYMTWGYMGITNDKEKCSSSHLSYSRDVVSGLDCC